MPPQILKAEAVIYKTKLLGSQEANSLLKSIQNMEPRGESAGFARYWHLRAPPPKRKVLNKFATS